MLKALHTEHILKPGEDFETSHDKQIQGGEVALKHALDKTQKNAVQGESRDFGRKNTNANFSTRTFTHFLLPSLA